MTDTTDTKTTRAKGRPRGFNESVVLDTAVDVFWRSGYARTSIAEISAATGLAPSSIYNAYGSKLGLFACALDRYLDVTVRQVLDPLEFGSAGLADVDAFFAGIAQPRESNPPGCLAANTIGDFRDAPPAIAERTARYRGSLRRAFAAALRRAAASGEFPAVAVEPRTDALLSIVIASSLLAAAGAAEHDVRALLRVGRMLATP